ncbi:MAG: MBL fold metallo-hydrolase [Methanomicrobiales archaeon]|nr:MBL fold metallo-hydrolase [Methanomicrobiales archaeon]
MSEGNSPIRYSFIARVPDTPGSLHKAAEIVKRYQGNINRIQFDRRIDPFTVFFELTAIGPDYRNIIRTLDELGYLQTSLQPLSFLKMFVYLPHCPGALFEFLNYTTSCRANIAYIDFDDMGRHPDRLTISLNLEEHEAAERLLDTLRSKYRIEVTEYDNSGAHLDDTVFYLRFAQSIRDIIGNSPDDFLLPLLGDINHIVQELMSLGESPKVVFESILSTGKSLKTTTGEHFYADVQHIVLDNDLDLYCFQPPCGGSIYLFSSPIEQVIIDTGYGIYYEDVQDMLRAYNLLPVGKLTRIIVTHADADHCGATGCYHVPALMHPGTQKIIEAANRAYGSRSEGSILEEVYTRLIGLFSKFSSPEKVVLFAEGQGEIVGLFPVMDNITIAGIRFQVLEGLGGHQYGQIYLFSENAGLIFTADTVINFEHLTSDRAAYSSLAAFLVTSVNVDSDIARRERTALFEIIGKTNQQLEKKGKVCLVCGGHGPVSILLGGKLVPYGTIEKYHVRGEAEHP